MRKIYIFLVIISSILAIAIAKDNDVLEFTPGMESVEIGPGASILVPEGTEKNEYKGVITIDDSNEYVVRRFIEVEKRLEKLEGEVEGLKKIQKDKKDEVLNSE